MAGQVLVTLVSVSRGCTHLWVSDVCLCQTAPWTQLLAVMPAPQTSLDAWSHASGLQGFSDNVMALALQAYLSS